MRHSIGNRKLFFHDYCVAVIALICQYRYVNTTHLAHGTNVTTTPYAHKFVRDGNYAYFTEQFLCAILTSHLSLEYNCILIY